MKIIGIDTARWQGVVPWSEVAAAGVRFAWIKVTHGLAASPDEQFARSWQSSRGALEYGRGGYHWLTDAEPELQVEHAVRTLERAGDLGELWPSVDWEEPTTRLRGEALVLHSLRALRRMRALVGGAVLYTGAWYVRQFVASDEKIDQVVSRELLDELCSYPLWHSEYPRVVLANRRACASSSDLAIPPPKLAKPWRDRGLACAVHQFDGNGGCLLPSGVDADFNATTLEGLARVIRVTVPAPSPSSAPETVPQTPAALWTDARPYEAPIVSEFVRTLADDE